MWGFVMSLNLERDSARSKKRLSISLLLCATIMFVMVLLIVSNPVYAVPHQTLTFSYSVSGGGSGYTAPTLSRTVNNVSTNIALTGTPTAYLTDTGTPWSVTNPLTDSDPSEHWQTSETTSGTVSTDLTIGFTYYNQYNVTFDASSNVKLDSAATIVTVAGAAMTAADLPYSGWFNSGSSLSYAYSTTVASTASPTETQYRWGSTSGLDTLQTDTLTVSGAGTITGNYVTQYDLKFAESGLDSSAEGTIVSVTVGSSPAVNVVQNDFTYDFGYVDAGTTVTYAFTSPVASSNSGERFVLTTPVATPASGFSLSGVTTVTGTYGTQYQLTLSSAHDTPTGADWYDAGSTPTIGMTDTAVSGGAGIQYVFTGWSSSDTGSYTGTDASHSVTMNNPITETASWNTQYLVTFTQTGITSDAGSNTVLTLGGSNYAYDALPAGVWVDSGTSFSWASDVAGATGERFVYTGDSGLVSPIVASGTDAATYKIQYDLKFAESGLDGTAEGTIVSVTVGSSPAVNVVQSDSLYDFGYVDAGTTITYTFTTTVSSSNSGEQFVLTTPDASPASGFSLSGATTITGTYKTQYDLQFDQSGLDTSAQGTIVSVTIGADSPVNVVYGDFTKDFGYVDAGTTITYTFTTTVSSSNSGEQFALTTPDASPASGFSLSGATTITGTYKTQYLVSFIQSGSSVAPTVTYTADTDPTTAVPFTVWVKAGTSITFAYQTTVSGTTGVQYVLTGTNATSPQTVNAPLTVLGSYLTQYYFTLSYSVSGGSGYSAPTFTANQLGSPYGQVLTTSATGYWFDAGASWTETNPLTGSNSSTRWQTNQPVSGTVSSATTIAFTYYHQFLVTASYSTSDSSTPSPSVVLSGTQFGSSSYTLTLTASSQTPWLDAGTSWWVNNPIPASSTNERWNAVSGTFGTVTGSITIAPMYYHQYKLTLSYSVSGGGSPTAPTFTANQCGSSYGQVLTVSTTDYWFDSGSSWTVTNPLADSGSTERWYTSQTVSSTVSSSATIAFTYYHQYELTMATNFGTTSPSAGDTWHDAGSVVSIVAYSPSVGAGEQYVWNSWTGSGTISYTGATNQTSVTMNSAISETASWNHQYKLTMAQSGLTDASGTVVTVFGSDTKTLSQLPNSTWVDSGTSVSFSYGIIVGSTVSGKQYVLTGVSGNTTASSVTVSSAVTVTGTFKTQYYLAVTSPYGTTSGQGWYDTGSTANAALNIGSIDHLNGTQHVFVNWGSDASGTIYSKSNNITMSGPKTATATWQTQYKLTVTSAHGSPTGADWYNAGVTADFGVTSPDGTSGTRYVFTAWSGDSTSTSASDSILMGGPKTVTATWQTQYELTVTSAYGSPSPSSGWFDSGSSITESVTSPVSGGSGIQYVCTGWSGTGSVLSSGSGTSTTFAIIQASAITWNWQTQYSPPPNGPTQYYLTVNSAYDSPSPSSGWFDSGSSITESVTSPVSGGSGIQYVCTGWSGTGSAPASGSASSVTFTITQASSITWNWKTQYYLTVNDGGHGTIGGQGWYDAGTDTQASMAPLTVAGTTGTQYVFAGWSGDATGSGSPSNNILMDGPKTATATWTTQYYLTVNSAYDSPSPSSGWFDSGSSITESVTSPVSGGSGIQYVCTGWSGTGSAPASGSASSVTFTITQASSITWNWKTQYYLTVNDGGHGTIGGQGWYDAGTDTQASMAPLTVAGTTGTQYVFAGWSGDATGSGSPSNNILMDGPKTATATWTTQYYLTVNSAYDSPSPSSGWFDSGSSITESVTSPVSGGSGIQYVC